MVHAEDIGLGRHDLFLDGAGLLQLALLIQRRGQTGPRGQGVGMVFAQLADPGLDHLFFDGASPRVLPASRRMVAR